MKLKYKDDWPEAMERYNAWWNHETFGRAAIGVTAPRSSPIDNLKAPVCPDTPEERWYNLDYISANGRYNNDRTFYGGEQFPVWAYGYPGNKGVAAFLGCPVHLDFKTGWRDPILTGEDIEFQDLAIDKDGKHWKHAVAWMERSAMESPGECIPTVGAFGGCGDMLASLRGTERLLFDCMERPDQVREAELYLMKIWIEVFKTFHGITGKAAGGCSAWFRLWAPGTFYPSQNDFSFNISTDMLVDMFLPAIEMQIDFLDYAVYHLDGVSAFRHIDVLCEIPKLKAIQVHPGAGQPSPLHFPEVCRKVQTAGKNLHITLPVDEVEAALREFSARGLFISTSCKTEEDARDLLKKAKTWSHD